MYNTYNYYEVMLSKDFDTITDLGSFGGWHKHAIIDSFFGHNYLDPGSFGPSGRSGPQGPPGERSERGLQAEQADVTYGDLVEHTENILNVG